MSPDLTTKMIGVAMRELPDTPAVQVRAALAAVLAMAEVRQAIHDEVRGETDAKLREMGVTGYSLEFDQ